ncbi:hypothetical protein CpecG_0180 [Chlamydia pecorum MC/MarsBar]|nr:hypothetical protein CpecS_0183 [Chlamydia pecorum VR629]ETF39080.1 hypothetical protein CpecF_0180 [Chlamydia pecorum DBDeUG]ETF39756.1 hypothetical protein CpecG_0180 [Chlamydia pecorum MC/MarsBar]ETF40806.1 hypothetical protein CpecA_0181 [Chlamydia pecorum IPTaLE]
MTSHIIRYFLTFLSLQYQKKSLKSLKFFSLRCS